MTDAAAIIRHLGLMPHPEGGHYRQIWAGPMVAGRASGTVILFLLAAGQRSHWHRVDADEIWHFHAGAPLVLRVSEHDAGPARSMRLGPQVLGGDVAVAIVTAQHWQAAETTGGWSLVSCTVSPGFRFDGFAVAPPGFDIPATP